MSSYACVPCEFYDELELLCIRHEEIEIFYHGQLQITGKAQDLQFNKETGEHLALSEYRVQKQNNAYNPTNEVFGIQIDKKNTQLIWLRIDLIEKISHQNKVITIPWQLKQKE